MKVKKYEKALEAHRESVKIAQSLVKKSNIPDNILLLATAYTRCGICYLNMINHDNHPQNYHENAIKDLNHAYECIKNDLMTKRTSNHDEDEFAWANKNLADAYVAVENYDYAHKYYTEAIELFEEKLNRKLISSYRGCIQALYARSNLFLRLNDQTTAFSDLERAIQLCNQLVDARGFTEDVFWHTRISESYKEIQP